MNIADLPVDETRRLTGEDKRALGKQLQTVLESNESLGSARRQHQRQQLVAAYAKEVGVDRLKVKLSRLEADVQRVKQQIAELGFSGYNGEFSEGVVRDSSKENAAAKRLVEALNAIQDQSAHLYSAKILSRLWLCSTVGEALVVMNEVVGNGIIPTAKLLNA